MPLFGITFEAVLSLPWITLGYLKQLMQWIKCSMNIKESNSDISADDILKSTSTRDVPSIDHVDYLNNSETESSCISDSCEEDEDDVELSYNASELELNKLCLAGNNDVIIGEDRWFWTSRHEVDSFLAQNCSEFVDLNDDKASTLNVERLVDYVMPSMDMNSEAAIDVWVEKYGASKFEFRYVSTPVSESSTVDSCWSSSVTPSISGSFVAVL
ncbi:uncharacterized protein PHALS_02860 [Plasmopara halstedii]|uniref:Uncharacterized protein n=1 Tax=Plasmopara halstedii TaxID=4781 RepID=A0A0P1AXF4_PLAHL|nr:uncharacterized protein PHALS_02860 [Plasmopara halstedii]CEG46460.1 hypothetical protein PHALS_02860 [Plasmopara halstedii]|eukprot:XP_024582829.1 hypothetical protein PHALS_02860 [Plasmopara halstedii]